jgi:type I restriction enzyme, S subunit
MVEKVTEGYKKTEVGVIPEDWGVKKLKHLGSMNSGEGITAKYINEAGNYPCFGGNGLRGFTSRFTHNGEYALIGRQGALCGNVQYVTGVFFASEHAVVVTPGMNTDIKWLSYVLKDIQLNQYSESSAQPGLSVTKILELSVATPTLKSEQIAIAEALSDMDSLISSLEKLIAKKQSIKQGAMQVLLTGKKRLSGFSGEWEYLELGSCADISKLAGFEYSKYFNSYNDGGEIIVIRGTNITKNKLDLTDVKTIPTSTSNFLKRSQLKKDDLVFAYVGTIGPVYLMTEDDKFHLGPNTARITVNEKVFPPYAFIYFTSDLIKKEIEEHVSVGAQPSLSMTKIRKFKICLPSYIEQTAIAQILSDMDEEIEKHTAKLNKYKAIKQGMMQELLTGKRRLV